MKKVNDPISKVVYTVPTLRLLENALILMQLEVVERESEVQIEPR